MALVLTSCQDNYRPFRLDYPRQLYLMHPSSRAGPVIATRDGQAGCISRTMKSVPRRRSWSILVSHPTNRDLMFEIPPRATSCKLSHVELTRR